MSLFACKGCEAKDAQIVTLTTLLEDANERAERQGLELLNLARETKGLPAVLPAEQNGTAPAVLDPVIEVFLDAKFVYGTKLWRQQRQEAVKLAAQDMAPDRICDVLAEGMPVPF